MHLLWLQPLPGTSASTRSSLDYIWTGASKIILHSFTYHTPRLLFTVHGIPLSSPHLLYFPLYSPPCHSPPSVACTKGYRIPPEQGWGRILYLDTLDEGAKASSIVGVFYWGWHHWVSLYGLGEEWARLYNLRSYFISEKPRNTFTFYRLYIYIALFLRYVCV